MTDRDVIERLQEVTGLGLIHDRGRRRDHWKQVWDWTVLRRENMCAIASELAPLLLQRRRESMEFIFRAADIPMPAVVPLRRGEPVAWAWVAGLIEGEGWITPRPDGASRSVGVNVESTDRDVIERLADLTGTGNVIRIAHVRPNEKPRWAWRASSRSGARQVLTAILPMLGERRTARANYVIGLIDSPTTRGTRRS